MNLYKWKLLAKMGERNISVIECMNQLEKLFPQDKDIQRISEGLKQGESITAVLKKDRIEMEIGFYCQYLPLYQAAEIVVSEKENDDRNQKKVLSELLYHFLLMIASLALLFLFSRVVMPSLVGVLDIETDESKNLFIIFRTMEICRNIIFAVITAVLLIAGYIMCFKRELYFWLFAHRWKADKLIRIASTLKLSHYLLILSEAGIDLNSSLSILKDKKDNKYVSLLAYHLNEGLTEGKEFEECLSDSYLDSDFYQLILLGLKNDDLIQGLKDYISITEIKKEQLIKTVTAVIKAACYLFASAMIVLGYKVLLLPLELLEGL